MSFSILPLSLGIGATTSPEMKLAQRTIEKDLIHYTPLSDQELIYGYLLTGAFWNFLICVFWFALLSLFSIGNPQQVFQNFILTVHIFLGSEAVAIFILPIYAIVQKQQQLILGQFVLFFIIFIYLFASTFTIELVNSHYLTILAFIITGPLFGYHTTWRVRQWRASFFHKSILLLLLYVDYFIIFWVISVMCNMLEAIVYI